MPESQNKENEAAHKPVPEFITHYRILQRLGKGGSLYRIRDGARLRLNLHNFTATYPTMIDVECWLSVPIIQ